MIDGAVAPRGVGGGHRVGDGIGDGLPSGVFGAARLRPARHRSRGGLPGTFPLL
jgi:hypothetical protein